MKYFFLSIMIASLLTACGGSKYPNNPGGGGPVTPPTNLPSGSIKHPLETQVPGIQRPLLNRYYRIIQHDDGSQEINAQDFKYQPRQSILAGYEDWDILSTPWPWASPADGKWMTLSLNRDARLVIVLSEWDKPEDAWLNEWKKGTTTGKDDKGDTLYYTTYTRDFVKGEIILSNLQEKEYFLLLAEKGGTASIEPVLPEGITIRPEPNKVCPDWLSSNVWTTKGPDGNTYKTWHPQVDPIYWCYYKHEHGSDPSLVGYSPSFEYIAFLNNNQAELHEGFKGFAIQDKAKDIGWYINTHSETGVLSRVCTRVHTVVIAAIKLSTGEKLLELGYKGDFGAMIGTFNDAEDKVVQPQLANCPNQQAISEETNASRRIRIGADNGHYERWDGGANRLLGMEFPEWSTGMGVDIRNPATSCKDINCTSLHIDINDSHSDQRSLRFTELSIAYNKVLDASDGKPNDGHFYTDVYGDFNTDASKNVVPQYIKPGFAAMLDGFYSSQDPWRAPYVKEDHVPSLELEDGLGTVN
jgi:hypothetical protein